MYLRIFELSKEKAYKLQHCLNHDVSGLVHVIMAMCPLEFLRVLVRSSWSNGTGLLVRCWLLEYHAGAMEMSDMELLAVYL